MGERGMDRPHQSKLVRVLRLLGYTGCFRTDLVGT